MAYRSKVDELCLRQYDDEEGSDDKLNIQKETALAGNSRTSSPTMLVKVPASPPAIPAGAQTDTIGQSIYDLPDGNASIRVRDDERATRFDDRTD